MKSFLHSTEHFIKLHEFNVQKKNSIKISLFVIWNNIVLSVFKINRFCVFFYNTYYRSSMCSCYVTKCFIFSYTSDCHYVQHYGTISKLNVQKWAKRTLIINEQRNATYRFKTKWIMKRTKLFDQYNNRVKDSHRSWV